MNIKEQLKKLNKETNILRNKSAQHVDVRKPGAKKVRIEPAFSTASTFVPQPGAQKPPESALKKKAEAAGRAPAGALQSAQSPKSAAPTPAHRAPPQADIRVPQPRGPRTDSPPLDEAAARGPANPYAEAMGRSYAQQQQSKQEALARPSKPVPQGTTTQAWKKQDPRFESFLAQPPQKPVFVAVEVGADEPGFARDDQVAKAELQLDPLHPPKGYFPTLSATELDPRNYKNVPAHWMSRIPSAGVPLPRDRAGPLLG